MKEDKDKTKEQLTAEEKYRSLFTHMTSGFAYCKMLFDENSQPLDFIYLEVNDAFEILTGLRREGVVDKRVTEAIPGIKASNPELFTIYGGVASGGKAASFEVYIEPLDRWLAISAYSPRKDYFVAVFENITERKKEREALRESEEKYRLLHENAGIGIGYYKLDGTVISYNTLAASHMNGVPADFIGKSIYEIFPKDEAAFYHNRIKAAAGSDHPIVYEDMVPLPIGHKYFLSTFSRICDSNHSIMGIQIMSQDITAQKQTEEALRESEEFRQTIMENSPYPVVVRDPNSKVVYVNPDLEKLTGYSLSEVIGTSIPGPWFPKKDQYGNPYVNPRRYRSGWDTREVLMQKKNGEFVWTEITGGPIVKEGQLKYTVSNWVDITHRKKIEEIIRYQALLVENVSDAVISTDLNFNIITWNKAAADTYGWQSSEVIGK